MGQFSVENSDPTGSGLSGNQHPPSQTDADIADRDQTTPVGPFMPPSAPTIRSNHEIAEKGKVFRDVHVSGDCQRIKKGPRAATPLALFLCRHRNGYAAALSAIR